MTVGTGSRGALGEKRTAPEGCVGRRFHRDSLASHAFLHLRGPKNPKAAKKKQATPRFAAPNSMTWACGAAKFSLEQVSEEERVEEEVTGCDCLCS